MLTFGKFSVFSLITLMLILLLQNPVYFEMDWIRYCEGEFPNHTNTVCVVGNYNSPKQSN